MKVHKVCQLDFGPCPPCDEQVKGFVDEVWGMIDFASEMSVSTYEFQEKDDVYSVGFDCGGSCQCTCDYWADLVKIIEWKC